MRPHGAHGGRRWRNSLALPGALAVPALVMDAGEAAASDFFRWCRRHGLALPAVQPVHVAAWVEGLGSGGLSAPSVKQRLAAMRLLFDLLVVGQVVPHNPGAPVRGPKHSAVKGRMRMPTREEAKATVGGLSAAFTMWMRRRKLPALKPAPFVHVLP